MIVVATLLVGCGSTAGTPSATSTSTATATTLQATSLPAGSAGVTTDGPAKTSTTPEVPASAGPVSLFDGVDLDDWQRYLGKPSATLPPIGLDQDPGGVFSLVPADGAPAIRISGETWGALISRQDYCDFRLTVEYKWGTQVWPPLNAVDSGIMVLSVGALGAVNAGGNALSDPAGSGGFMVSMEYQLTPSDIGAMYNLGPISFAADSRVVPTDRPGTWNQVVITHRDGELTFSLNGMDVATGSGFQLALPGQPASALTCGKLQLQSEGAEVFFRAVTIETLP
jgi:hypothetical protein